MKKPLFSWFIFLVVVSIFLPACRSTPESPIELVTDEPISVEPIGPPLTVYNESPVLAKRVVEGELPSVDNRLPPEPIIIEPVESGGEYGGTWHIVTADARADNIKMYLYDPPIRWKADLTGYEPGMATYEWSSDGKTFILHFTKGIKWSDGVPFTMDDIKFWWEDMATNPDMNSMTVPWFMVKSDGRTPMDMEFPDEYTWVWKSDQAIWVSPYFLAQGFWEWEPIMQPKHFLMDYHPRYNAGADYATLEQVNRFLETPGFPCLLAWCLQDYTPGDSWLFARNPYYWKVDTQGNQLPYIDYLQLHFLQDKAVRMQNISQGKYEATFNWSDDPSDISFLTKQAEINNYELWSGWTNGAGAWPGWLINQDYNGEEPEATEIRDLLRNKWFRKGLSVSLDRYRYIDVVYAGIGTPQQATISPQSWHFAVKTGEGPAILKEWQESDAVFDVGKAELYFDKINFIDQNGDGWRELPSGNSFEMILDMGDWNGHSIPGNFSELTKEYWEAVGIKIVVNNLPDQANINLRQTKSLYMLRSVLISEVDIYTNPDLLFPLGAESAWPLEGIYRQSGGSHGWLPDTGSPAARLLNLYDLGINNGNEQKRHEIMWAAFRIHLDDGPFLLGVAGDQPVPVVVKNGFHNIPTFGILGSLTVPSPGNVHPEQFWMEAGLR